MTHLLIQADARRIPLADRSVHCVVTSPPYFSLRDYGTAKWMGGDPGCDHWIGKTLTEKDIRRQEKQEIRDDDEGIYAIPSSWSGRDVTIRASNVCGKCGARRIDSQLGLEATPDLFVAAMVQVFREVWRVLRDDGTAWVNLGDSYANTGGHTSQGESSQRKGRSNVDAQLAMKGCVPSGLKPKDLVGIPWRVAFALQADGWWLRSAITWCKTSPMPESVTDRPTSATEMLFLLTKSEHYFYDADAVRVPSSQATISRDKYTRITTGKDGPYSVQHDHETPSHPGGRNLWNYWVIPSESYAGAHFATFPRKLVAPCIRAGSPQKGVCPTCGAPWERVTEERPEYREWAKTQRFYGPGGKGSAFREAGTNSAVAPVKSDTIGWRPTCSHDAEPVPATVFDLFAGSGTTGVVALALNRRFIGVDLSAKYLGMAERRISRPHAPVTKQHQKPMPLFGDNS